MKIQVKHFWWVRYAPVARSCYYGVSNTCWAGAERRWGSPPSLSSQPQPQVLVKFDNPEAVTRGKSTWEVFRGWLVFKTFTFDALVDNSMKLYHLSKRILGSWLTGKCLRATAFGQFAGGVTEKDTEQVVRTLARRNISSIWFFSIERNLDEVPVPGSQEEFEAQERLFDEVNQRYLKSIEMSGVCNCDRPVRFAAVKWTAIVNPHLLNKLNKLLVASQNTFLSLASPGKYLVDRAISQDTLKKAIPDLPLKGTLSDGVGFADWNSHFSIASDLHKFQHVKDIDSVLVTFSDMEKEQYSRFLSRLVDIGECGESSGVRVLVDAEQTYFQQAIEHLTLHLLSGRHNSSTTHIYNTLQTYLVKSYDSLLAYLQSAKQYGIKSGVKVVRGCYMEHERQHAREQGEPSPVHPTKALTDESYHLALGRLMEEAGNGSACVMVASHNKDTVQTALGQITARGIPPHDGTVTFGQLLGMGDHLTYPLASAGYMANKVVPYGHMDDLMPFLARRGNENRGMMRNTQDERVLYWQELKGRILSRTA